ncbi:MAG: hypothetical protein JWN32_3861, partial [Solirubrobacterales bacterium]|nr:hypothetical protein [Solirubrobacterales bacterium]
MSTTVGETQPAIIGGEPVATDEQIAVVDPATGAAFAAT